MNVNLKMACMEKSRRFTFKRRPPVILSKFSTIVFTSTLLVVTHLPGAESALMPGLRALADAERSFARSASEHGIRAAFLQFLAEDSLVFDPGPTNGKKLYAGYDDKGKQLIWQPAFVIISSAGDLGLSTGPWKFKKASSGDKPIAFGHFVSVWKKQADNSWKVAVDLGIDHPAPANPPGEMQLLPPESTGIAVDVAQHALEKAEKTFSDSLKSDAGAAVIAAGGDEVRVYRENSFPAIGKTAAKQMVDSDHTKVARKGLGGGISVSGDLAYRYGSYATEPPNAATGYFLSIWKLNLNRDWKVILDLQKQTPVK
jgi:ketosteroid isomerase-like protein